MHFFLYYTHIFIFCLYLSPQLEKEGLFESLTLYVVTGKN